MLTPAVRSLVAALLIEAVYVIVQCLRQHSGRILRGAVPNRDRPPTSV